jgi:hypothetical protein
VTGGGEGGPAGQVRGSSHGVVPQPHPSGYYQGPSGSWIRLRTVRTVCWFMSLVRYGRVPLPLLAPSISNVFYFFLCFFFFPVCFFRSQLLVIPPSLIIFTFSPHLYCRHFPLFTHIYSKAAQKYGVSFAGKPVELLLMYLGIFSIHLSPLPFFQQNSP